MKGGVYPARVPILQDFTIAIRIAIEFAIERQKRHRHFR